MLGEGVFYEVGWVRLEQFVGSNINKSSQWEKGKSKVKLRSSGKIVQNRSLGLNSGQKATLKYVICEKKTRLSFAKASNIKVVIRN